MKVQDDSGQNSESVNGSERRRFLKRGSAGLIVASLPSTSVWGQDGLIAGSIVASGTGSTSAANSLNRPIQLGSPGKWKSSNGSSMSSLEHALSSELKLKFCHVFGKKTFYSGTPFGSFRVKNGRHYRYLSENEKNDFTLDDILMNSGSGLGKCGGPANVNFYMVEMYLNARFHGQIMGSDDIYFPVVKEFIKITDNARGLFDDRYDFAAYLYEKAYSDPNRMGIELQNFLYQHHT